METNNVNTTLKNKNRRIIRVNIKMSVNGESFNQKNEKKEVKPIKLIKFLQEKMKNVKI